MKSVNTLTIPALLCKVLYFFIAAATVFTTVIFIHLQIDPSYYAGWNAELMTPKSILSITTFERWSADLSNESTLLSFDKIKKTSLYFNYFRVLAILYFIFLTIKEFSKIIESVKLIETFHQRNILSFQKMFRYLLATSILFGVTIVNGQEANLYSYSIQVTPLILSFAALMMAEIFKQGNQLLEENQLTI